MENINNGAGLEGKKQNVSNLVEKIKKSKTILIASVKYLPSSQFQQIKKNLRDKAEIIVTKKSTLIRAIGEIEKGVLQNLKKFIGSDIAIFFSDLDAFELSSLLTENQSPAKAKSGDISPENIKIEEGPTDLVPGPAISELSNVGLKVAVEGGKLAIKKGSVVVKAGEEINEKVASVLGKLNILPMKVGFLPIAAYDSISDRVYEDIKIDKEKALEELRNAVKKCFGFAINIDYICSDTIKWYIIRAGREENALKAIIGGGKEEKKVEKEMKEEEIETAEKVKNDEISELEEKD